MMGENRVIKPDTIGADRRIRIELRQLCDEPFADLVVRIETKNPVGADLRLLDREAPLIPMAIKSAMEYAYIGEFRHGS